MSRYNYPRPRRRTAPPNETRLLNALLSEREYAAHLIRQRSFLLNAMEYMSKWVMLFVGGQGPVIIGEGE